MNDKEVYSNMSWVTRKPVYWVSDLVRLKQGCTAIGEEVLSFVYRNSSYSIKAEKQIRISRMASF